MIGRADTMAKAFSEEIAKAVILTIIMIYGSGKKFEKLLCSLL